MTTRTRTILLAAVAAALPVFTFSLPASAQTRVNQDGHALDANTRVGSDGSNTSRNGQDRRGQTYTGNQVVTGNVSGARAFRGPVGYRDANEFSGPVAGLQTDRFIRDSAGAPTRSNPNIDYGNTPTAFYGDARSTPPPTGYRVEGFTGAFFNTGAGQQTTAGRTPYDRPTAQVFDSQTTMLRSGSVVFQGQDDQNRSRLLYASPLSGVMALNPTMLSNDSANGGANPGDATGTGADARRNPTDRFQMTPAELQKMRDELNGAAQDDQNPAAQPDPNKLSAQPLDNGLETAKGGDTQSARSAGANRNQNAGADVKPGTQLDNRIDSSKLDATVDGGQQQGLQRQMAVPPAKQSKLYAELQQRLQQQQSTDPQVNEQNIRALRRAQDTPDQPGAPGQPGQPGADPAQGQQPGAAKPILPIPRGQGQPAGRGQRAATSQPAAKGAAPKPAAPKPAAPAAQRPAPIRIKSLAEGVQAKGLHDLLAGAESLMKEGNFRSAIEKYAAAEQVAPNNPMIRLGRAQAELGAARYVSADEDLRQAVKADPALLMGQYDLESFIGRDRLSFLIQDLKQMAASETTSARPMVLLAYIAYGTPGLESAAADYLNQAAERAGRPDPLIEAMRKHWVLPEATPAAPEKIETPAAPEKPEAPATPQPAPADQNK